MDIGSAQSRTDDSGFIVSESLTRPLNFRHGVGALIGFRVKISGAAKYVALQQKAGYRAQTAGADSWRPARGNSMANSPFEVPNEMRDFAERSVEQARKAFEGFLTVAQRASGVAGEATATSQGGAKSVGAHVLSYTERNVNAAFDLAQKLVKAKDPQEALALQSEYLKSQLAVLQEQAKEFGSIVQKSLTPGSS
jgi:phasin